MHMQASGLTPASGVQAAVASGEVDIGLGTDTAGAAAAVLTPLSRHVHKLRVR